MHKAKIVFLNGQYMRSHGHAPSGRGSWAFEVLAGGNLNKAKVEAGVTLLNNLLAPESREAFQLDGIKVPSIPPASRCEEQDGAILVWVNNATFGDAKKTAQHVFSSAAQLANLHELNVMVCP